MRHIKLLVAAVAVAGLLAVSGAHGLGALDLASRHSVPVDSGVQASGSTVSPSSDSGWQ